MSSYANFPGDASGIGAGARPANMAALEADSAAAVPLKEQAIRRGTAAYHPLAVSVTITAFGWLGCVLWPPLLAAMGIPDFGHWYLDSYAILAANDAVAAGLDPAVPNAFDVMGRPHSYSDWWLLLHRTGLTRESNFLVGTIWVGAFALAAWLTARPRRWGEAIWLGVLMLSPPVLLGVNRANNDLVIFVLFAVCGVAAGGASGLRQFIAVGALTLATGLKFYPVVGVLGFLWVRPIRLMPWVLMGALLGAGTALVSVLPQIGRGMFTVDSWFYTFGAAVLGRDLGWPDSSSPVIGTAILALGAFVLAKGRLTVGLASRGLPGERLLATMGAVVLLGCFMMGVSYAYRWIFVLWMALWLWRRACEPAGEVRQRWVFRLGVGLVIFCLWSDGLMCLVINRLLTPMTEDRLVEVQAVWRWCTQPWHWLLMGLFAGWLLEAAYAIGKEWWLGRKHSNHGMANAVAG